MIDQITTGGHDSPQNEKFRDEDGSCIDSSNESPFRGDDDNLKGMNTTYNDNFDYNCDESGSKNAVERLQHTQCQGNTPRQDSIRSDHSIEAPCSQVIAVSSCTADQSIALSTLSGISNSIIKGKAYSSQSGKNLRNGKSTEIQEVCIPDTIFLGDTTPKICQQDGRSQGELFEGSHEGNLSRKAVKIYVSFVILFCIGAVASLVIILMNRNSVGRSKLDTPQELQRIQDGGFEGNLVPSTSPILILEISDSPSISSKMLPTKMPVGTTEHPTSTKPSENPTEVLRFPSSSPSVVTVSPTFLPTFIPSFVTELPSSYPTKAASKSPTSFPTHAPMGTTDMPNVNATQNMTSKTKMPSVLPTLSPSTLITSQPSISKFISILPSSTNTSVTSEIPSDSSHFPSQTIKSQIPSTLPSDSASSPIISLYSTKAPSMASSSSPSTTAVTESPTIYPSQPPVQMLTETPSLQTFSDLGPARDVLDLFLMMSSHDQGKALQTTDTPQYLAFSWLAKDSSLDSYSNREKIQRFVLATLYFSTNGPNWKLSDGWMSDADECDWFNYRPLCDDQGLVSEIDLRENSLSGTLPVELSWLENLIRLNLKENRISGQIPTEFGQLNELGYLQITGNVLSGRLPTELAELINLGKWRKLYLPFCEYWKRL
jgi:hypothetical protein